jgi:transglutaminase-like putative cysteine protease
MELLSGEMSLSANFIDSHHPAIRSFAQDTISGTTGERDRAVKLYYLVRDQIRYDPYVDYNSPSTFRASDVLAAGRGFCVGKAVLLAACARAVGIPARLGFADVRNHMTSPRLKELLQTDVFRWHAYTDLQINGRWVKATPAFDGGLCARLRTSPLDFDGQHDSLFQPVDAAGQRRMEYIRDRGVFEDVPFAAILRDFKVHYPALLQGRRLSGDFKSEALPG